ncbi:MAG: hypothetical protein AAGD38_03925 [Acidobacteriota bacterium]
MFSDFSRVFIRMIVCCYLCFALGYVLVQVAPGLLEGNARVVLSVIGYALAIFCFRATGLRFGTLTRSPTGWKLVVLALSVVFLLVASFSFVQCLLMSARYGPADVSKVLLFLLCPLSLWPTVLVLYPLRWSLVAYGAARSVRRARPPGHRDLEGTPSVLAASGSPDSAGVATPTSRAAEPAAQGIPARQGARVPIGCVVGGLITLIYPVAWMLALLWEPARIPVSISTIVLGAILWLAELRFNHRHLAERLFETFQVKQFAVQWALLSCAGLATFFLFECAWAWVSGLWILVIALKSAHLFGMCLGNLDFRKQHVRSADPFPWELSKLYERSLNPNVRKTYGPFLYIVTPLLVASVFHDPRLAVPAVFLLADNLYTRLRMTIPVAMILTTQYEKGLKEWLLLKDAAGEFAIPSLVLGGDQKIPKEPAVQQDLVRVREDDDWEASVRTVIGHCHYIIFETHSLSPALEQELAIIQEPGIIERTVFLGRPNMHPRLAEEIQRLERLHGRRMVVDIKSFSQHIARHRDFAMGGLPRSPRHRRIVYSRSRF